MQRTFGLSAFFGCKGLIAFCVHAGNVAYTDGQLVLFIKDGFTLLALLSSVTGPGMLVALKAMEGVLVMKKEDDKTGNCGSGDDQSRHRKEKEMNLSGHTILGFFGADHIPLDGDYSFDRLAETMIENWVPYIECHRKCSRADSCKYAPKKKGLDIRCGVVVEALRNFVNATFEILKGLNKKQRQGYLDGAFFLSQFVLEQEGSVGMCTDKDCVEDWGTSAPMLFGRLTQLRGHLNALASCWKDIPEMCGTQHVLLVEGESERAFLTELKKSHSSWFLGLNVDVYGGRGNRRPKRIEMLLQRYARQGYTVYATGDADGSNDDIFKRLVDSGLVTRENTFAFAHDFETSLPQSMFLHILKDLHLIDEYALRKCCIALEQSSGSVTQRLKEQCHFDIGPHKVAIAQAVASVLNHPDTIWWKDDEFMNRTELGHFLRFIQGIR